MFRKKAKQSTSTLGIIIDQPLEDFKKSLKEENVNVGTMNNLILYLNGAYADLRQRKDTLIASLNNEEGISSKERKEIEKAIKSIYAELIKIEGKILYLKERVDTLVDVDGEIDSTKE